jgi:hypothetical protein
MISITDPDWMDLQRHISSCERLAQERDKRKKNYRSTKHWTKETSTHFIGCVAEAGYCKATTHPMVIDAGIYGDNGTDFIENCLTYQVKGARYWQDPDLKEDIAPKVWSDVYVLVAVRDHRYAKVVGWATKEQMQNAPIRDYGYGPRRHLTYRRLRELGQLGLPPGVEARRPKQLISCAA